MSMGYSANGSAVPHVIRSQGLSRNCVLKFLSYNGCPNPGHSYPGQVFNLFRRQSLGLDREFT